MNRHDDYLWDRSGAPDPTTERLERLLGGLAHDARALPLDTLPPQRQPRRRLRPWLLAAAAAAAALVLWSAWPDDALHEGAGERTFVATDAPLVVPLGSLAAITLAPGSELQFSHWRADQALFRLQRGALVARVEPPPAVAPDFFVVDTPLGRVTDKGCRYELRVADDGSNHLQVEEGAVTFTFAARTVFVPAGAGTVVTAAGGPGTPLFADATPQLRKAVQAFDAARGSGDVGWREKSLAIVEQLCVGPRDSLPLWHALLDDEPPVRERAEAALLRLVGPPEPAVTKQAHWDAEVWLAFLRLGPWREPR